MILECYAVFDRAVGAFMNPFYAKARGEALRLFMDAVGDKQTPLNKHPEDYSLYWCGHFDDSKGTFFSDEPVLLLRATEVPNFSGGEVIDLAAERA